MLCFISHRRTEPWGSSVLVMENEGKAFGRLYWYNEDNTSMYIEGLSVDPGFRKQDIATELLKNLEKMGKDLGATSYYLLVERRSWMYEWYQRCGYSDFKDHEDKKFIWMKK